MKNNNDKKWYDDLSKTEQNNRLERINNIKELAEAGNAEAMHTYAVILENEKGMHFLDDDSPESAKYWHERAFELGHSESAYKLANYHFDDHEMGNWGEGVNFLRIAARDGHLNSQIKMAEIYDKGLYNVKASAEESFKWHKAASHQDTHSKYMIANMYKNGDGVKADFNEFLRYMTEAANDGHIEAKYQLSTHHIDNSNNEDKSYWIRQMKKTADAGHTKSQYSYAMLMKTKQKNNNDYVEYLEKSANTGHLDSLYELFMHYEYESKLEKAVVYLKMAADQEAGPAQFALSKYYKKGLGGIEKNEALAEKLMQDAADSGFELAINEINKKSNKKLKDNSNGNSLG